MSDVMLLGVLEMPHELWRDDPIDVAQRHARYIQAAERIKSDGEIIERLTAEIERLRGERDANHASFIAIFCAATAAYSDAAIVTDKPLPAAYLVSAVSDGLKRLRAEKETAEAELAQLRENPEWVSGIIKRREDMSARGYLQVMRDGDGDVCVTIKNGEPSAPPMKIEFCTVGSGGGRSPRTHKALCALMVAMRHDQLADPGNGEWIGAPEGEG